MDEGNFAANRWQGDTAFLFPKSAARTTLAKKLLPIGTAWYSVESGLLPERNQAHSYSAKGATNGQQQAGQQTRSHDTFRAGFTQVLGNMMPYVRAAATVSNHLMAELGAPFSVNAYRAPQGGESLCPHNDPQDVLILQLGGCRTWTVWDEVPNHLLSRPFDRHVATSTINCSLLQGSLDAIPKRTFELRGGSLLYIPRGLIHRTGRCGTAPSLHWTLTGGTPYTSLEAAVSEILKRRLAALPSSEKGPPGTDVVSPHLKELVESAVSAPNTDGLALRSGLDASVLLHIAAAANAGIVGGHLVAERRSVAAAELGAGLKAAATTVRAALGKLQYAAEAQMEEFLAMADFGVASPLAAVGNKGEESASELRTKAAVAKRIAGILEDCTGGSLEADLLALPAKMRWLNASFRKSVDAKVTDTCRAIAGKYSAAVAPPDSHSFGL
jgi:hypothetical protein